MPACPRADDRDRLLRLLADDLPEPDQAELVAHLDGCPDCRGRMERLAARSGLWNDLSLLRDPAPEPPTEAWAGGLGDEEELPLGLLDPPDEPGHLGKLGGYDVLRLIGRGGMGMVFLARDRALDRLVAIKLLTPGMAATGGARRRFAREAKAAAAVVHDHVVTIHAVDTLPQGVPYLVMQYVAGKSVQELIDRGKAPELAEVLRIGSQAASALAAAHAQGLIHRDIKPANILLENGVERVKITDFGLARAVDDATMTQSGVVAGTPQYMSPEQARGDAIDHRTDLFSLGSVLYALCTGQAPFRGNSSMATLKRVCEQTPRPIRELNPDIPAWLVKVIDRLHAKEPADRYGSAAEVAELLGRCLAHVQQPANVPLPEELQPPRIRRAIALWSALPASLLILAMLAFPATRQAVAQAADRLATVLRLRTPSGTFVIETEDPDVSIRLDGSDLQIKGAGVKELRLAVGSHNVQAVKDGKVVRDELVTITRGGRTVLTVRREPDAEPAKTEASISSAALEYARSRADQLADRAYEADQESERARRVKEFYSRQPGQPTITTPGATPILPGPAVPGTIVPARPNPIAAMESLGSEVRSVAFSPDGRVLAYGMKAGRVGLWKWQSQVGSGPSGEMHASWDAHPGGVESVAYSPDGRFVASCGWDHHVKVWDLVANPAAPKLVWDFAGFGDGVRSVAFSPDGSQVAAGGFDRILIILDTRNGQRVWTSPTLEQPVNGVAYSPDGRLIALAMGDYSKGTPGNPVGQPGEVQVWKWPGRKRIATLKGWKRECKSVAFSPDGRMLAATGADGTVHLYHCALDSCEEKGRLDLGPWPAGVAFRPDGTLAVSNWSGEVSLWDPLGPGKLLTRFKAHVGNIPSIAFSRDGQFLATGSADGSVKVWNVQEPSALAGALRQLHGSSSGAVEQLAAALKAHPRPVSPGPGTRLYLRDLREDTTTLFADTTDRGLPYAEAPDWSHDGTRIVFRAKATPEGPSEVLVFDRLGPAGRPVFRSLGSGDSPRFSPDDRRIAFSLWPGEPEDPQGGTWLMDADGGNRRRVCDLGAPFWSPDGKTLLINDLTTPTRSSLHDLVTGKTTPIRIVGRSIFSWPRWAGPNTLVACVGPGASEPDSLVLLDVSRPSAATVTSVLWSRSSGPDVVARWPVFSPANGTYYFVGDEGSSRTLYALSPGGGPRGRLAALEGGGVKLGGLSVSPDGRYLLFATDRLDARPDSAVRNTAAASVERLATLLERDPLAPPGPSSAKMRLYLRDRTNGRTTMIVDPNTVDRPVLEHPDWSHDGTRIVFHALPRMDDWTGSRIQLLGSFQGKLDLHDLGPGCCARFSPDDRTLAFALVSGKFPGASESTGVWLMDADGKNRRRVADFGAPFWSPDGKRLLINSPNTPTDVQILDLQTGTLTRVRVPGKQFVSWPRWWDDHHLVASLISGFGDEEGPNEVVLLDINQPGNAQVEKVYWRRPTGTSTYALWPQASPTAVETFFIANDQTRRRLLSVSGDVEDGRETVEAVGGIKLTGLSMSPDRRYLVFAADRVEGAPGSTAGKSPANEALRLAKTLLGRPTPASPRTGYGVDLYLRDLDADKTTLIATEPHTHLSVAEDPDWSHDGRRFVFHAGRDSRWQGARIFAMEMKDGRPDIRDLGPGCCPRFSPDDRQIAFTLFENQSSGEVPGVYLMNADGTGRRKVSDAIGAPFWLPGGTKLLLNSYIEPNRLRIVELSDGRVIHLPDPDKPIYSWVRPMDAGKLLACIGEGKEADRIVTLDDADPTREQKILSTLWDRGWGPIVFPRWPVVSPSGDVFFVGDEKETRTLYRLHRVSGNLRRLKALETGGPKLSGLSLSPDGKFLLFASDRLDTRPKGPDHYHYVESVPSQEDRLASTLKQHPPRPSARNGVRMQLYMRDLADGTTTLVADEPGQGMTWTGAPDWSPDGARIIFDNGPGKDWTRFRLMDLEATGGQVSLRELGQGNCPRFSPDGRQVAFLLNPGAIAGDEEGVWIMDLGGINRRRVGPYGAPFWSPEGDRLLINSFSDPAQCELYGLETHRTERIRVPGYTIFSWPKWAGPNRLVACLGTGDEPDRIVLLDVGVPSAAKIVESLWQRTPEQDVYPRWPLYDARTGTLYFVGVRGSTRTLLEVKPGAKLATALEGVGHEDELGGLTLSPNGRYLLFGANRPDRGTTSAPIPETGRKEAGEAALRLAEELRLHPPRPSARSGRRMQLYLHDLQEKTTTLVADEPVSGLPWSASPIWSHDGKRILLDNSRDMVTRSRLMLIESREGKPTFRDVGPGALGEFSPDDRRITFAINPNDDRDNAGIWIMNADGTDRRRLIPGVFGAPSWSPDRRHLLICTFEDPAQIRMYSFSTGELTEVQVPGERILSWPGWAGPGTLVASIGRGREPDSIVLLDVTKPDQARVQRTLWKRSDGPDVFARWPVYSPATGFLYFIGVQGPNLRAIYQVSPVRESPDELEGGRAVPVEGPPRDDWMGGLSLSPGGRFLLFNANRPDRAASTMRRAAPDASEPGAEARRLAEALEQNPAQPGHGPGRRGQIYLRNLKENRTSLIVDEPSREHVFSGMPDWSHDGKRIVFDSHTREWSDGRLLVLERADGVPSVRDLGPGICARFSPDDRRIAFSLNPRDMPDQTGFWVMNADGSDRRRLIAGGFGAPYWSPDRRQLLINVFQDPAASSIYDFSTGGTTRLKVAGQTIFSWPTWAGPHTLVACVGRGQEPDAIVLLDVTRPAESTITRTLWKRSDGPDVYARWPVCSAATGECYFIGVEAEKRQILKVNDHGPAVAVEGPGRADRLGCLALSPDGHFLLFAADREDRAQPVGSGTLPDPVKAVADAERLAGALRRHPPRASGNEGQRMQLYLRDLETDDVHLIVDEPRPGLTRTSMPNWSHDGQRLAFHVTPQNDWRQAELFALRAGGEKPVVQPLGAGTCPAYSPDDRTIAFLVWPRSKSGEDGGVHLMHSDGTGRRRVGGYGAPSWSPDGTKLLINPISEPTEAIVHDLATGHEETIRLAGYQLVSWPRWVGRDRVLAVIYQAEAQRDAAIAILNVREPSQARIETILWKRGPQLDVLPRWPIRRASTGEVFFAGVTDPNRRNLYRALTRGEPGAVPLQAEAREDQLEGLIFSPGERYLVFNANRPDRSARTVQDRPVGRPR